MANSEIIRKLEQLLDEGIISQEEFESRKSQVLSIDKNDVVEPTATEEGRIVETANPDSMKLCPNCGTKGHVLFCPECGTRMIDEKDFTKDTKRVAVCPNCGYEGDYAFCPECGTQMVDAEFDKSQTQNSGLNAITVPGIHNGENSVREEKRKKKRIVFAAVAACIVILIVIIATSVGGGGTQTVEYEDYSFKIPDYYVVVQDEPQMQIYSADNGATLLTLSTFYEPSYTETSFKENKVVILESLASGLVGDDLLSISDDGSFSGVEVGDSDMNGKADAFYNEDTGDIYFVVILQEDNSSKNYTKRVKGIVKSAKRLY